MVHVDCHSEGEVMHFEVFVIMPTDTSDSVDIVQHLMVPLELSGPLHRVDISFLSKH